MNISSVSVPFFYVVVVGRKMIGRLSGFSLLLEGAVLMYIALHSIATFS